MNIDFQYQSIEIDKGKCCDLDQYRFPIEIDDDTFCRSLSIIIYCYRKRFKSLWSLFGSSSTLKRCCPCGIIESFSNDIM